MRSFITKFFTIGLSAIVLMAAVLAYSPITNAVPENDFSREYGLIVHNSNEDRSISRIKALEVLLKYFPDHTASSDVSIEMEDIKLGSRTHHYVQQACDLGLLDCKDFKFYPHRVVSQGDFLKWFFKLKYFNDSDYLEDKYPHLKTDAMRAWVEARRLGLLTHPRVTYRSLQDFLYRDQVIQALANQPYLEGLSVDAESINAEKYHNLAHIDSMLEKIEHAMNRLEHEDELTTEQKRYYSMIEDHKKAFNKLKKELKKEPYLLRVQPLDKDVAAVVDRYALQDVLQSYSYDYSHNKDYRQHNLTVGTLKMHGEVLMPGEVIDYWEQLSDNNLSEFKYGWVIAAGIEQWQFGGGICGSSSMLFTPAWKAGLDIVERKGHSKYYSDLYPIEEIGLDATVYRPRPNLKVRNNTNHPIVFNIIDDKESEVITLQVLGNNPYKNVEIEGPIFVGKKHVKWVRHLEQFDGKIVSEPLETVYDKII